MTPQIGLQTFTIRQHLKSPDAIADTFKKLADMGLQAVELAYVKLRPQYIDALAAAGKQNGIAFRSSQITFAFLDKERDWVARFHEQLGCTNTAVSVLPVAAIRGDHSRLMKFTEELESLGNWYRERGIQLCFHHHDFEFCRYGDALGLDIILDNTSAKNIALELDTYWTQRGGRSPHDLINDLAGRVKVVHLRDYKLRRRLFELLPQDAELGAGNLDIPRIIHACCAQGVEFLAIEQNTTTPFESVGRSVRHLHELGFQSLLNNPPDPGQEEQQ